jgi:mRNA interferase RelE/StbE
LKVEYRSSFTKDLRKLDSPIKKQVIEMIERIEKAKNLGSLENIKKLKGAENYYRIRLGDYRAGILFEEETIVFVRFLHRKDIYRYFP